MRRESDPLDQPLLHAGDATGTSGADDRRDEAPVQSYPAERIAKFGADNPMERPAQPAEIAPAFVSLACDESRFVNGEVLGVTGGRPLA